MNAEQADPIVDAYPLSPMQQGMLLHSVSNQKSGVGIEQVVFSCDRSLNIQAFRTAWDRVVSRHAVLRTSFCWRQLVEPIQQIHQDVTLPLVERDWTKLSNAEQEVELERYLAADRQFGFDLSKAPNLRVAVVRLAADTFRCIWTFHRILLDDRSIRIVLKEVLSIYDALCRGEDEELPRCPAFRDYISWLQQQDWSKSEIFWRSMLQGITAPTTLRTPRPSSICDAESSSPGEQEIKISTRQTSSLKAFAATSGVTLNTLIQGALAILLSRYSGEENVVFGIVRGCCQSTVPDADSMVGTLTNTVPLRVSVCPDRALTSWLEELRDLEDEIQKHEHTPLMKIQQWTDGSGVKTAFDGLIICDHLKLEEGMQSEGESYHFSHYELKGQADFPLVLQAIDQDRLLLKIAYCHSMFDDATIGRMIGHIRTLLESMIDGNDKQIGDLSMLSDLERHQILFEWNHTHTEYPQNDCIHELFERQVEKTPDATAMVMASSESGGCAESAWSYLDLNRRANKLAHHLIDLGVGPEVCVGVFMERSMATVMAILATLKAGGAYVPLDPSYPRSRLAFMLNDTAAPILLTEDALARELPDYGGKIVRLDTDWETIEQRSDKNCQTRGSADGLAYVMYTSGSTGNPKGVCVVHRGVVRLVKETNYVDLSNREVFLQFAPISFDASTFEIWGSLLNGARLVIFPPHLPTLEELGRVIRDYRISTLWLTASLFQEMVAKRIEDLQGVRQLLAGGEALSVPHVRRAFEELPTTQIINGYGPTENTTFTCCHTVGPDSVNRSIPIGRPIANTRIFVLDRHLQPTPVGIPGEMYAGGDGLARGYLNASALTAEKFIKNPFSADPKERLYKVGDLVRYLASGDIEFLGRIDNQVKIRGFRIELGEIENRLVEHPSVRQAVVVVRETAPGNKSLLAYLVGRPEVKLTASELQSFLEHTLPDYMIPAAFVMLDEIPLSPNGKIDRMRLPEPDQVLERSGKEHVAPRSEMEKEVCRIWTQVLGIKQIGVYDDFFELGGHSLMVIRAISNINDRFGSHLSPNEMYESRNVAGLAALLESPSRSQAALAKSASPQSMQQFQVANVDLELIGSIAADRCKQLPKLNRRRPYRMRESWICRHILAPLYRIQRGSVRSLIQLLILKLEGGQLFTVTLRKLYAKHYDIHIGDYSEMCFSVYRMQRKTTIGRYTGIYPSVMIQNADHPRNTISSHGFFYNPVYGYVNGYELPRVKLAIGNDVWIGHNATILYPTKTIGDGAVIAAGSVVVEDVPPYAIVGGYPARILRYRFSKEKIEQLLKSRWWEASLEELECVKHDFTRPLEGDKVR